MCVENEKILKNLLTKFSNLYKITKVPLTIENEFSTLKWFEANLKGERYEN